MSHRVPIEGHRVTIVFSIEKKYALILVMVIVNGLAAITAVGVVVVVAVVVVIDVVGVLKVLLVSASELVGVGEVETPTRLNI